MQPLSRVIPLALGQDQGLMWGNASPPLLGPHCHRLCAIRAYTHSHFAPYNLYRETQSLGEVRQRLQQAGKGPNNGSLARRGLPTLREGLGSLKQGWDHCEQQKLPR